MTSKPSPGIKRSIDSIYNVFYGIKNLSQGHEKPLRVALYNIVAILIVLAIFAVSFVLRPFFKPLLWAFLLGAVLFPFKASLAGGLKTWFEELEQNDTHICVGIIAAPVEFLDGLGRFLGNWLLEHAKILIVLSLGAGSLTILLAFGSRGFFCMAWRAIIGGHELFTAVVSTLSIYVVLTIILLYFGAVILLWKPEKSFYFTIAGQTLWIIIAAYFCSLLGAFQVPAFICVLSYAIIGLFYDIRARSKLQNVETKTSFSQQFSSLLSIESYSISAEAKERELNEPNENTKISLNIADTSADNKESEVVQSDLYFKILFFACAATILYKNMWLLFLTFIPILIHLIHHICTIFGIKQFIFDKTKSIGTIAINWILYRHSALLPICLPGILHVNATIHQTVRNSLKSSIDVVSSIIMIILLIFTVTFASIFFCVEIYSEAFAVAQLGSDLFNRTITARPDLMDLFPQGFQGSMDDILDNAHEYGTQHIETYVDELFKDTEPEQAKKLKIQILNVWDRLIQSWMDNGGKDSIGPKVTSTAFSESFGEIVDNPELITAAKQGIIGWAKGNIGMLMEVLDSVWIILRQNMYLLGSMVGTFFSMLLGGGQAVITLIVNTVIFFTALFYLLSSSDERYAGLTVVDALGFSWGTKVVTALESSISSVIMASLKIALFHGLFTWLTHTWFGAHVVFLPAVIAAVLAAAPFLGTYFCCIPAFLDLWLSQDRFYMAILLFLIHFIFPSNFVDPAILGEIKGGGHTYLTGLSIAGGIYWLGIEGAILGPLLYCFLIVIFELCSTVLKESPSTPGPSDADKEALISDIRLS